MQSVVTAGNVDGAVHTQLHTSSTVDTAAAGSHRVVEFYTVAVLVGCASPLHCISVRD